MKFQREKLINNKTKQRALLQKHQTSTIGFNFFAWNFADGIRILKTNQLFHSWKCQLFRKYLCCAGAATQVSNFRFMKFKTLKWTIPSLSDLEFAEQKEKAMITVTRRYVIKTNHCELSWQPTAAVAKQGQVSFFTFFFLYLIERTRRLLNNKRDERMYVSSSREVLLMFFFSTNPVFAGLPIRSSKLSISDRPTKRRPL